MLFGAENLTDKGCFKRSFQRRISVVMTKMSNPTNQVATTKKKMTPESLSWWSDTLGLIAVGLTLILALIGVLAWRFATWSADANAKELKSFQTQAQIDISAANERAANAQKEAAEAKLELARIDPVNLPIKSVRVDVFLLLNHGPFTVGPLSQNPFPSELVWFCLRQRQQMDAKIDPLALMACSQLEPVSTYGVQKPAPKGTKATPTTAVGWQMTFLWPSNEYGDALRAKAKIKFGIEKDSISTSQLDKEDVLGVLDFFGLPPSIEVLSGSCILTINGAIQRRFSVPDATTENGLILVPEAP